MSGVRLPKRVTFGNLEGAERRGRGTEEKDWVNCVQSDARAFGMSVGWEATALEAGVWVETVTEGRRRFLPRGGCEEEDAARHHQEKREANETRNLLSYVEASNLRSDTVLAQFTSRRNPLRARDEPRPA